MHFWPQKYETPKSIKHFWANIFFSGTQILLNIRWAKRLNFFGKKTGEKRKKRKAGNIFRPKQSFIVTMVLPETLRKFSNWEPPPQRLVLLCDYILSNIVNFTF